MENYVRVKQIGEGSFGKALLMKRKDDGKQCVVKQICISKMSSKEREESKKEVRVLSQLKHPNIVSYIESFLGNGNLYIVMDFCEGGDLYQLIVRQRGVHMEESKVLDIFVQCCLAIKHIHDRKILHRDIKTQNIFLTKHHIVKLGDFGIARVLKSTMELARTCIGTPYYLSPEIVENKPYNNKSDVWSLGCVLYELATLKHAFEAGNMKNLVLKICRGSYNPVPTKYSFELRSLVAHCLKRNAADRPSINTLLKKPIIQQRISRYLSPEEVKEEFSHTVIHRKAGAGGGMGALRPSNVSRPPSAVVKKTPAVKRQNEQLAAVYGASVAKKPLPAYAYKKPPAARPVAKPKSGISQGAKHTGKREADARERRRKEILAQEQQYNDYMKKVQKQRYEKQQALHINRAREAGWKNVLGSDELKKNPMKKYQPEREEKNAKETPVTPSSEPEEKPIQKKDQPKKQPPVELLQKRVRSPPKEEMIHKLPQQQQQQQQQWMARPISKAHDCDPEKAKILEDFWERRKQAAANKARGVEAMHHPNPLLQMHEDRMAKEKHGAVARPPMYPMARDNKEKEYLKQLEAIRRQNYMERRVIKAGHNNNRMMEPGKVKNPTAQDPRFDAEARKKKIEALKVQAEQRAVMLKQQLESRRRKVQERMELDRMERMRKRNEEKEDKENRHFAEQRAAGQEPVNKIKVVTPVVGIDTAMKEVIQPKLFRSLSEGEIEKLVKPPLKAPRKNWAVDDKQHQFAFADIPLEITASAMEATKVIERGQPEQIENRPAPRKGWGNEGKTQFISNLHNFDLIGTQMPTATATFHTKDDGSEGSAETKNNSTSVNQDVISNEANIDTIIVSSARKVNSEELSTQNPGSTITLSPASPTSKASKNIDETICLSSAIEGKSKELIPQRPGSTFTLSPASKDASKNVGETICLSGPPSTKNVPVITPTDNLAIQPNQNHLKNATVIIENKCVSENVSPNNADANKNISNNATINEAIKEPTVVEGEGSGTCADKTTPEKQDLPGVGGDSSSQNNEIAPTISDPNLEVPGDVDVEETIILTPENCSTKAEKDKSSAREEQKGSLKAAWTIEAPPESPKQPAADVHNDSNLSNDSSFHTPGRSFGLQTGSYDVKESQLLRTCSLPDLRASLLPQSSPDNVSTSLEFQTNSCTENNERDVEKENNENDMKIEDLDEFDDEQKKRNDVRNVDRNHREESDNDDEDNGENYYDGESGDDGDNEETEDDGDVIADVGVGDNDQEEYEDYESMLESMRNVLGDQTAHPEDGRNSNNSTKLKNSKDEATILAEEDEDDDWEDGEDTERNDDESPEHNVKNELEGTLFSRIEESRQALENELGMELFIKIYRHVQMIQDNEDDALEVGTTEISELLGEKEHLYQKVLYLVMADSAYSENNDGT